MYYADEGRQSSPSPLTPRSSMRSKAIARFNEEQALKWASKRKSMIQTARNKRVEQAQGIRLMRTER